MKEKWIIPAIDEIELSETAGQYEALEHEDGDWVTTPCGRYPLMS